MLQAPNVAVVQTVPDSLGKVMLFAVGLAWPTKVMALEEAVLPLNNMAPVLVPVVPSVRALAPATVMVPVKLAALEMVCPLMRPEVKVPDMVALLLTVRAVPAALNVEAPVNVFADVPD